MRDYGKIECAFWRWSKRRSISDQGKLLAMYLLSGPHSNSVGCYELPDEYVCADLKWAAETVVEGFAELSRNRFAYRCEQTDFVFVRDHLNHNKPANPKVGVSMAKIINDIPTDFTYWPEFIEVIKPYKKRFPDGFIDGLLNGIPNQEHEQEQEQEQEEDSCSVQADTNFVIQDKDQTPSFAEPPFQPKPEEARKLVDEADKTDEEDLLNIPSFLDRRTPAQLPPGKFPTLKALGSGPARKYPAEFERFWATFPKRATDTKAQAYTAWLKGVKAVGVDALQSAAEAYANFCAAKDHPSKLVATWINAEGWTAEYGAVGGGNGGEAQTPYQAALSKWYAAKEKAEAMGSRPPPKPQREDFVQAVGAG